MPTAETPVPAHCPNPQCRRPLNATGQPHCPPNSRQVTGCCPWVQCVVCKTLIDTTTGNHMPYAPRSA